MSSGWYGVGGSDPERFPQAWGAGLSLYTPAHHVAFAAVLAQRRVSSVPEEYISWKPRRGDGASMLSSPCRPVIGIVWCLGFRVCEFREVGKTRWLPCAVAPPISFPALRSASPRQRGTGHGRRDR